MEKVNEGSPITRKLDLMNRLNVVTYTLLDAVRFYGIGGEEVQKIIKKIEIMGNAVVESDGNWREMLVLEHKINHIGDDICELTGED